MSSPPSATASALSPDLIPYFSDPAASMIVAKIAGRDLASGSTPGSERGTLKLSVAKVIHSETLKDGDAIETPFERATDAQIRFFNRANQWNALPLNDGDLMLISVKLEKPPKAYTALAASPLSSATDPQVGAAQQCYRIELLTDNPAQKKQLAAQALEGTDDLPRFYALDLIAQRDAFGREAGAGMIEAAMGSEKVPGNTKQDFGFRLAGSGFFDATKGAEPVNAGIVSALGKQLAAAKDAKSRGQWVGFLSSCVSREFSIDPKQDRESRLALVRKIQEPSSQQMISALSFTARDNADPGAAKQAKRLLEVWQSASASGR